MRRKITKEIQIPSGIECKFEDNLFICKKNNDIVYKKILLPSKITIKIDNDKVVVSSDKANKKLHAIINTIAAHINNLFKGHEKDFIYELEICNVHFPMSVKAEKNQVVITNFLGEKQKRTAKILQNVNVEVKANMIIVSSKDIEAAGQTAANIEHATQISKRDRRVFQDGCFITKKPGDKE